MNARDTKLQAREIENWVGCKSHGMRVDTQDSAESAKARNYDMVREARLTISRPIFFPLNAHTPQYNRNLYLQTVDFLSCSGTLIQKEILSSSSHASS